MFELATLIFNNFDIILVAPNTTTMDHLENYKQLYMDQPSICSY